MAYINRIIGPEEKLVGIARLHWIYILKGVIWFLMCALFGWALNTGILMFLAAIGRSIEADTVAPIPLAVLYSWVMPASLTVGVIIFSFYLIKVLSTEIGLTNRRVIHKKGLLFVDVHEVDIEEIRGERIDLGALGRILGYGYIHLDCRFIGDVQLPAIEQPERFMRALHAVRSQAMDTLTMVMGKGKGVGVNIQDAPQQPPGLEMTPPPELTKEEEQRILAQHQLEQQRLLWEQQKSLPPHLRRIDHVPPAQQYRALPGQALRQAMQEDLARGPDIPDQPQQSATPTAYRAIGHSPGVPFLPPSAQDAAATPAPPPQMETPPQQPAPAAAPVTPETVAQIVEQVVPQIVEKIAGQIPPQTQPAPEMTEKMKAEGLREQPPLEKAAPPLEEELLHSFDEASAGPTNGHIPPKPPAPEPDQAVH